LKIAFKAPSLRYQSTDSVLPAAERTAGPSQHSKGSTRMGASNIQAGGLQAKGLQARGLQTRRLAVAGWLGLLVATDAGERERFTQLETRLAGAMTK